MQLNNFPKAYTWLKIGGEKGIIDCYDYLWQFSDETQHYEAKRFTCEKLVELGRTDLLGELGYLYVQQLVGTSREENDKQAVFYFKKSIEMNQDRGSYQSLLTMMGEKRGGLTGSEEEQLSLLNDWVKRGEDPEEALYLLGQYYHHAAPDLAEKYYSDESEEGHGQAFATLFEFKVNKTEDLDDKKKIFKEIRLFAENEYSPEIQFLYGSLLYRGVTDIAESNQKLALKYITQAAETLKSAQIFLKKREQFMKLREISEKLQKSGVEGIYVGEDTVTFHSSFFEKAGEHEEIEETEQQKMFQEQIKKIEEEKQKLKEENKRFIEKLIQEYKEKMLESSNKKSEDLILGEEEKKRVNE